MAIIKSIFDLLPKDDGIEYTFGSDTTIRALGVEIRMDWNNPYSIKFRGLPGWKVGARCNVQGVGAGYDTRALALERIAKSIHNRAKKHHARVVESIEKGRETAQNKQDKTNKEQALLSKFRKQLGKDGLNTFQDDLLGEVCVFNLQDKHLEVTVVLTLEEAISLVNLFNKRGR